MRGGRSLSALKAELGRSTQRRVSLGEVVDQMQERGSGIALLLLTLPNVTVVPSLPLLPLVLGIPAMVLCASMMMGRTGIWLPTRIAALGMRRERALRVLGWGAWLTSRARPRLQGFTEGPGLRFSGLLALVLTALTCLPLPGFNIASGLGLLVLAAGLAEDDGLLVVVGAVLGFGGSWLASLAGEHLLDFVQSTAHTPPF